MWNKLCFSSVLILKYALLYFFFSKIPLSVSNVLPRALLPAAIQPTCFYFQVTSLLLQRLSRCQPQSCMLLLKINK